MPLNLNGWDMHDIHEEMRDKTLFEVLNLFKQKDAELSSKGTEYIQALDDKNEKAKERIEKEATHLEKEKCVIALHIAEELTKN